MEYAGFEGGSKSSVVSLPAHTVTNTYETNRDVLLTKHNQRASDNATISSVTYNVNKIGQRESVAQTYLSASSTPTTANVQWGYNATGEKPRRLVGVLDRSEAPCLEEVSSREAAANQLTKADHSDTAQNRAYDYDGIGNRLSSTSPSGASPASAGYTPNALNQYDAINTFVPTYDDDGNQINAQIHPQLPTSSPASLSPVSCVFSWDGENRKIEVKDTSNNSLVKHHYDSQSRKIATIIPTEITLYIYNGWNSIAEYKLHNSSFTLHTSLLWGLDLSGGEQGAGGVGGLLVITDHSSMITSYFPCYDGNGNVTEYIDTAGAVAAHYQYDPFGNTILSVYYKADDFAYRFSTKPIEALTGLYYYGYRWYGCLNGRWLSRDPVGELGGLNIYGYVDNNSFSKIDLLGLEDIIIEMNRTYNKWDTLSSFRMYAKDPKISEKCPGVTGQTVELKKGRYRLKYDENYRYKFVVYPIPEGKEMLTTWSSSDKTSVHKLVTDINKQKTERYQKTEQAFSVAVKNYNNQNGLAKLFSNYPVKPASIVLTAIPTGEIGSHNFEIHTSGEGFTCTRMHIGTNCQWSRGCPIVGQNAKLLDTEITKYETHIGQKVPMYNFEEDDSIYIATKIGEFYKNVQAELGGRSPTVRTTISEAK